MTERTQPASTSHEWLLLLLAAATLTPAAPVEYILAPAPDNRFELTVEKTGLYRGKKHLFVFERYDGWLVYDPEMPENSQVQFRLESQSIVCKDTWVSPKDLKKIQDAALNDMLAAGRYQYVTFTSDTVLRAGPDRYEVRGRLTIRDTQKPATVLVTVKAGETLSFEGNAVVKMTDFRLKPPSAALGLIGTRDEMKVSFTLSPVLR